MLEVVSRPATQGGHKHPGILSAVVPCRVRMCTAQGGWQEDTRTAMARCAWRCWGSFGRGGCLKEPPSKGGAAPGRAAQHARTCSCLPRARTRLHWRPPGRGGGRRRGRRPPAGCDDSLPHTSRKCAERGTRWRVQTKPGPRPGGGALPGTCPRDDSGKRLLGEEERE